MKRIFFAAVAATMLMVGCAQTDAPQSAAPVPSPAPQSAVKAPSTPAPAGPAEAAPSPLLNQPGSGRVISGGSREVCVQQCERSYQVCMDGSATRADTTSGTLYEGRLFGPAARCESSLSSCLKRCNTSAAAK